MKRGQRKTLWGGQRLRIFQYDPENHRYLTKNVNSYFGLINTLSTSYKENKKGINQSSADLSPLVARSGFEPETSGL